MTKRNKPRTLKPKIGIFSGLKAKIIAGAALVGGFATLLANFKTIKEYFTPKHHIFSVKGIVLTATNSAVDQATVRLRLWSTASADSMTAVTDKSGAFRFADILDNKYDSIRLEASLKTKHTVFINAIQSAALDHVQLSFPAMANSAKENPITYRFYWLKGHAIDCVLEGKIDSGWEPYLSRHPTIVMNGVLSTLDSFQAWFSESSEFASSYVNLTKAFDNRTTFRTLSARRLPKRHLPGTAAPDPELIGVLNRAQLNLAKEDAVALLGQNAVKKMLAQEGTPIHFVVSKKQFDKLVQISDSYGSDGIKLINLLAFITKENFPEHFIEADILYDPCGGAFSLQLLAPSMSVEIALAENRDNSKIRSLGEFYVMHATDSGLRELGSLKTKIATVSQNYYPPIKMTVDDKFIIPLRILFKTYRGKEFEYGPTDSLISQIVDDELYAIRKQPLHVLNISDRYEGGSCPYVFTRSINDNVWKKENHILYGYHNKSKEAWQSLTINRFDGTIEIRELDPETSYMDELYVKITLPDGSSKMLHCENELLAKKDRKYLVMQKGEKLRLHFELPPPNITKVEVVVYGYYIRRIEQMKMIKK